MTTKYVLPRLGLFLRQSNVLNRHLNNLQIRNSSYETSKKVENIEQFTSKFEVTKSSEDWQYVDRILAPLVVPLPKEKDSYASGWKPQSGAIDGKYFVPRSKNFMIPVYLNSSHRGMRKITKIQKIQGDIFQLEKDLKKHLESTLNKEVATQVNELVGYIRIKGDHVNLVKEYLIKKGF